MSEVGLLREVQCLALRPGCCSSVQMPSSPGKGTRQERDRFQQTPTWLLILHLQNASCTGQLPGRPGRAMPTRGREGWRPGLQDRPLDRDIYSLADFRPPWPAARREKQSLSLGPQTVRQPSHPTTQMKGTPNKGTCVRGREINRKRGQSGSEAGPPAANPSQDVKEEIIFL